MLLSFDLEDIDMSLPSSLTYLLAYYNVKQNNNESEKKILHYYNIIISKTSRPTEYINIKPVIKIKIY